MIPKTGKFYEMEWYTKYHEAAAANDFFWSESSEKKLEIITEEI